MTKTNILLIAIIIFSVQLQAQVPQSTTQIETKKGFFAEPKLSAGFKSYNNPGRERELAEAKGRRFKSKNEFSLTLKDQLGWGVQALAVETLETKGDAKLNKFGPADPSLTFSHPIFENDIFKISGAFRQYFPVSDRSVTNHIWQHAYYLNASAKLPGKIEITNILTPRYFTQDQYKPADTLFYAENWNFITKKFDSIKWLRVGLGQHHQVEVHPVTQTGVVADIYPIVDFIVSSNIYFGPRVYFPVLVSGSVADSAKNATLSEAQAEFYFQATL